MDSGDRGPATVSRGLTPSAPPHPSSPQATEVRSSSAPYIVLKSSARGGAVSMLSPRVPRPDSASVTAGVNVTPKTQLTRVYIPAQQIRAVTSIGSGSTTVQPLRIIGSTSGSASGVSSAVTVSPRTLQMRMVAPPTVGGSPTGSVVKHVSVTQSRRPVQSPRKIISTEMARVTSSPHRIILKPSSSLPNAFVRVVSGGNQSTGGAGGINPTVTTVPVQPLTRDTAKSGSPSLHAQLPTTATGPIISSGARSSPASVTTPLAGSSGLKVAVAPKLFQRRILPAPIGCASTAAPAATIAGSAIDSQPAVAAAAGLLSLSHHTAAQQQQLHSPAAEPLSLSTTPKFGPSSQSLRPSPVVNPRTDVPNLRQRKACNCTKSQCLKLYCDCFAAGEFCKNCNCTNCYNSLQHEEDRQRAVRQCLDRNPQAFKPKIGKSDNETRKHQKGCHCKKSGCQKNYCECYEAKIFCSSQCKCVGCHNFEASSIKPLSARSSVVSSLLEERRAASRLDSDSLTSRLNAADESLMDSFDSSVQQFSGFSSSSVSSAMIGRSGVGTNSGSHPNRLLAYGELSQSERSGSSAAGCWDHDTPIDTISGALASRAPSSSALLRISSAASASLASSAVIRVTRDVIDASLMCLLAEVARADGADDVERRVLTEFGRCLTQIIEHGARKPVSSSTASTSQLPTGTI